MERKGFRCSGLLWQAATQHECPENLNESQHCGNLRFQIEGNLFSFQSEQAKNSVFDYIDDDDDDDEVI
jgi:hypothetical protein